MAQNRYNLHVVSHVHWDREWYLPFQQFRIKLIDLIDHLLNILATNSDYQCFMLDGQAIMLEDYLEIRPENKTKLKEYVKNRKILIGPWYVLPDEFLVSGESLIRNLMLGHQIGVDFGQVMAVGYLPDMFGHISQMPQILRGFEIDNAVIWRGVHGTPAQLKSEFIWESPDGSSVLAIHLPDQWGYMSIYKLSDPTENLIKKIRELKNEFVPFATTSNLLIMNGVDHVEPQTKITEVIKMANLHIRDAELVHSSLPEYIKAIKNAKPLLKRRKGEFRATNKNTDWQYLYADTLSSRMYLKQMNAKIQILLEKWVEPFAVWVSVLGEPYPTALLSLAWKYLLKNHPHDSIYGCSVDQVHNDMMCRFSQSRIIGEDILNKSLTQIIKRIDCSDLQNNEKSLVVFNALSWVCSDLVTATIDLEEGFFKDKKGFVIRDLQNNDVPYQLVSESATDNYVFSPIDIPRETKVKRHIVSFFAKDVPSCGYKVYKIIPVQEMPVYISEMKTNNNNIENRYLRITVNRNGTLNILDKVTGSIYKSLNYFEDSGDSGSPYQHIKPKTDKIVNSLNQKAEITLTESGPVNVKLKIRIRLQVPDSVTKDGKRRSRKLTGISITSFVNLVNESPRLDIVTTVDNKARDHRLRAVFPSGLSMNTYHVEGQFEVLERKVKLPRTTGWREQASPTYPQQSFLDLNDGNKGLTIINEGLPEYEVSDDKSRSVYLTLLRTTSFKIGLMSGSSEGAQCLGEHVFRYSIMPHAGTWKSARTYQQAYQHNVPLRVIQTAVHNGDLPKELSFVSLKPAELVISAIKKAEMSDSLIVRFFNIVRDGVSANVKTFRKIEHASKVNLREQKEAPLPISRNNEITFNVDGNKIVNIKWRMSDEKKRE